MTATITLAPEIAAVYARSLGNDSNREAWLHARLNVVTATEAKVLYKGSAQDKAKVVREKVEGSSFSGNQYTEWGKHREPAIAAATERYGLQLCGELIAAEQNPRHAATPDQVGVDFDGDIVLGEIKTSKHDMSVGSPKFEQAGYLFQMIWQGYCVGARRVLYTFEQHDDDWSRWASRPLDRPEVWDEYGPRVIRRESVWIDLTDPTIAAHLPKMIAAADRALERLDKRLAEVGEQITPTFTDEQVADLVRLAAVEKAALSDEQRAKALKEESHRAAEQLFVQAGVAEAYSQEHGGYKLTWSPAEETTVTQVDKAAAKEADPFLYDSILRAELTLDGLRDQALEHEKKFQTTVPGKSKPARLTVTKMKGEAA
ncbi:YqaJ viral recombinase family protein [Herbiconiux sp. KACC 21604]|uniref:YqaJ viral recombinase family protein n=1 Tax=unclassified Herbiconiux TaxID=2618217 RepID=UPI0014929021|nr:YqaJ viral recombinase family protein [Herbiconiux sp. SALV-R1]QJU54376.1 hypothetical protein HL652_12560 [Herbiconiux sp. SALV-R1]WPO85447.1 YqaJ viral recombinase family protein [Herbiconiux sp. KACC 21604]